MQHLSGMETGIPTMDSQAKLLVGYDVESSQNPKLVDRFLRKAKDVHGDFEAPCTLFLVGKVVENNWKKLSRILNNSEIFDLQQHTYSHTLLKTVCIERDDKTQVIRSGSLKEIEQEIRRTNDLLSNKLGINCKGLTGPWGYYRGLSDRPDLLEILHRNGIRFLRTWARNEKDFQPVSFEIQPFWYVDQGFPDMLELPIQGWQDVYWRQAHGWQVTEGYLEFLRDTLDFVEDKGLVWCYGTHDWSSIKEDPDMSIMRGLLEYARERSVDIVHYNDYYQELSKQR